MLLLVATLLLFTDADFWFVLRNILPCICHVYVAQEMAVFFFNGGGLCLFSSTAGTVFPLIWPTLSSWDGGQSKPKEMEEVFCSTDCTSSLSLSLWHTCAYSLSRFWREHWFCPRYLSCFRRLYKQASFKEILWWFTSSEKLQKAKQAETGEYFYCLKMSLKLYSHLCIIYK